MRIGRYPAAETVSRHAGLLKRFNLLDSTQKGYERKPKFNKFIRRFSQAHPEFFGGVPGATVTDLADGE